MYFGATKTFIKPENAWKECCAFCKAYTLGEKSHICEEYMRVKAFHEKLNSPNGSNR